MQREDIADLEEISRKGLEHLQNENPTGARYNNALDVMASPTAHLNMPSSESQGLHYENLPQQQDHKFGNVQVDTLGTNNVSSNSFDIREPSGNTERIQPDLRHIDPNLINPPPTGVQPYDPYHDTLDPLQPSSSHNGLETYDPSLRMDVLTNKALLTMLQAWQDVIDYGEERYTLEHPHFQTVVKELMKRGMMSADWKWAVNMEEVDMALARVVKG